MNRRFTIGLLLLAGFLPPGRAADFFFIRSVKLLNKEPKDGIGVWRLRELGNKQVFDEFLPCLEVKVSAAENAHSDRLVARAYFFNQENRLIASQQHPSKAGSMANRARFEMPVLFYKENPDRIFFEIPEGIRNQKWKAVVVFGDKHEVQSACHPATESDFVLDYPEKKLVYDRKARKVQRNPAMDPLIEHVVKTRNPKMPQITLFLRLPKGASDASEIGGVMAICMLSDSLEDMKRELQKEEMSGDYNGLFRFANDHDLAILAWGARRLWDPDKNYDDLTREEARNVDESLDIVVGAWERGVQELSDKYGIPNRNFLLWGAGTVFT